VGEDRRGDDEVEELVAASEAGLEDEESVDDGREALRAEPRGREAFATVELGPQEGDAERQGTCGEQGERREEVAAEADVAEERERDQRAEHEQGGELRGARRRAHRTLGTPCAWAGSRRRW